MKRTSFLTRFLSSSMIAAAFLLAAAGAAFPAKAQGVYDLPICVELPATGITVDTMRVHMETAKDIYKRSIIGSSRCDQQATARVCSQINKELVAAEDTLANLLNEAVGQDSQGLCFRCNPDALRAWAREIHDFHYQMVALGYRPWSDNGYTTQHVLLEQELSRQPRACDAASPTRNAWVLEDIRINPGNYDLRKVVRFGNGEETTKTCSVSAKNLGVTEETRRPDGTGYGYRYQFVFDRPPDRIVPGEQYTINIRGSGGRFPERGSRYVGQLYFSSDTLGIRPSQRQPFVIPEPQGDMTGEVVISTPQSASRNALKMMASLGNEAACRVEYVYRPEF